MFKMQLEPGGIFFYSRRRGVLCERLKATGAWGDQVLQLLASAVFQIDQQFPQLGRVYRLDQVEIETRLQ